MRKNIVSTITLAGALWSVPALSQTVTAGYSSNWWSQIGLTNAIETTANGASSITIGFVDTGVIATNTELKGRVSASSGCAALSFGCSSYADNNGHGTAVASIAAGSTATGGAMSGVAAKATILAEKSLNALGSGYTNDVANGITKAVNGGAQIINLSLTYSPTADVISAINYAASKGAIIVFAGGNASTALNSGANSTGLTSAALSRLVFVGSVGSSNKLSSFSNIPGTGSAIAGTTKASYSSLWISAPGENIIAPGIMYGANSYAYWSGTSMAAPVVSGALALLEATWPVLIKNGTATSLLFQTAKDLGNAGVDSTYGNGLVNLTTAFQPVGTLNVTGAGGKTYSVTSLSTSLLTGGALGSLTSITSLLSKFTALDSFQRNFQVDLSGLVAKKPTTAAQAASSAIAPAVVATTSKLSNGASLSLASAETDPFTMTSMGLRSDLISNPDGVSGKQNGMWLMELTDSKGETTIAMGQGFPVTASFSDALWGAGSAASLAANGMGISNALLGYAEGGSFGAWGSTFGANSRFALSWTQTQNDVAPTGESAWQAAKAQAIGVGFTTRLGQGWTGGFTVGSLSEENGMLGSTYNNSGAVGFGQNHHSASVGLSTSYDISETMSVMADATVARTNGATVGSGLIQAVTPVVSRAVGIGLIDRNALAAGDSLSAFVRKPMRVVSGEADVSITSVDASGTISSSPVRVALSPDGNETDLVLGYSIPLPRGMSLNASATLSQDAENISGLWAAGAVAHFKMGF